MDHMAFSIEVDGLEGLPGPLLEDVKQVAVLAIKVSGPVHPAVVLCRARIWPLSSFANV